MAINLVITIDVEPDCTPTWGYSEPLTFNGVLSGIRDRLQPLFNKYDACPTYLINNVVLENDQSIEIFKKLEGKFELGTHLHPEFIEPNKQFHKYAGIKAVANQCFLDPEIEFYKLQGITELFINKIGYQPLSFRAGRFSAGPNTIECLRRLGYKVDTSVTPHLLWDDKSRESPIDFTEAFEQPYFIKQNSLLEKDTKSNIILEVPVSVYKKKSFLRDKNIWLRPGWSSYKDLTGLTNDYKGKYRYNKNIVLNMMLHNVEVLPGISPYAKNEKECASVLSTVERYLSYCKSFNIKSVTLNELYGIYRQSSHE